jgi:hypothetical protein
VTAQALGDGLWLVDTGAELPTLATLLDATTGAEQARSEDEYARWSMVADLIREAERG